MIRIVVAGAKGRMGGRICELIEATPDLTLAAAIDRGDSLEATLAAGADALIDFTSAEASARNALLAADARVPVVIGTTGMSEAQSAAIMEAARAVAVLRSSNMSIGVNVMWCLIEQAARSLGNGFSVAIEETHHAHKLDRPSGTAKTMAECAAVSGRRAEEIAIASRREGEVVGDHTITFASPGETLAISHHAVTRDIFAAGAVAAARWIVGKPARLYGMADVLGLRPS